MQIFDQYESNVRCYCRNYPTLFESAINSYLFSQDGKQYIDFLAGSGAINFGHNNKYIKDRILQYIKKNGLIHGLDLHTTAKKKLIETLVNKVLKPRDLNYKIQFPGPTGTNAVEAALKLARKCKNRDNIFSFMGGFHGVTLGSLSATSNIAFRNGAGIPLNHVTFMPFPFGFMESFDTISYIETVLSDPHSGISTPAAIIVEAIQGEGGIVVAPVKWMQQLRRLCDRHDILLICDEIQMGVYRTGDFFSFERSGIVPDIITLSKSIGGYGLPTSLVLFKPELDIWKPGEHNGTFRGNQLAFVAAVAALEYVELEHLPEKVMELEGLCFNFLQKEIPNLGSNIEIRGRGLIWGIDFSDYGSQITKQIMDECFDQGLIIECAGRNDSVLKVMPPLTIEASILQEGLHILKKAIKLIIEPINDKRKLKLSLDELNLSYHPNVAKAEG